MTLYIAVHEIQHSAGDARKIEAPGTAFTPAKSDVEFLLKCGSIREPSEAEAALAAAVEARKAGTPVEKKLTAAEKKAAEKAAAEAAEKAEAEAKAAAEAAEKAAADGIG